MYEFEAIRQHIHDRAQRMMREAEMERMARGRREKRRRRFAIPEQRSLKQKGGREPARARSGRGRLRLQVVDLESNLLRWERESAFDALLMPRDQDVVEEALPTLLRLMDSHDRPAALRRASRVEDLTVRQPVS
jgi:hypothetical protein